jgi:hypothetical protein
MPHLPPTHHETSKRDSLNETKVKEKQSKTVPDSNSTLAKSMTHHNQTKELTTWFLNLKKYLTTPPTLVALEPHKNVWLYISATRNMVSTAIVV